MNGLPINIDLSDLVGLTVTQICFGFATLIMRFDPDVDLTIESDCILTSPAGQVESINEFRNHAVPICGLLGEQLLDASRDSSGGLLFKFQSGTTFQIINDSVAYESFQLRIGSQLFVA